MQAVQRRLNTVPVLQNPPELYRDSYLRAMPNSFPIPRDIPLDLPAPAAALQVALVVFFVAHILFVNLTLGSALLTFVFELLGLLREDKRYDRLAHEIAATITVNKSMAVVLGIGPLLVLNVLYTIYFYTSSVLIGGVWLLIIPLVITAFLLLYLHKYMWERMADLKWLHIAIVGVATLILLAVPLIFLTNVNLMLFPGRWYEVRGFFTALGFANVWPRYLHFLLATFAASGLFLGWYFGLSKRVINWGEGNGFARPELLRLFLKITFYASVLQFAAGPLVLFTLPTQPVLYPVYGAIGGGVLLASFALALLWQAIHSADAVIGQRFWLIVCFLAGTVAFMATGRHFYREAALAGHRVMMADQTLKFKALSGKAYAEYQAELAKYPPEQRLFTLRCGACHAIEVVRVGPPLREIAKIYAGRPDGIVAWAKAPGKKRAGFPQMPSMSHVTEADLKTIASYMLKAGGVGPVSSGDPKAPAGADVQTP
jgi:cytochrome c